MSNNNDKQQTQPKPDWGFYAMTPRIVRTQYKDLSHTEKWLYSCLRDLCGHKGTCFRTLRSLEIETDISIASLSKMIPRLHKAGLIHAEKKRRSVSGKEIWHISIVDIWQLNAEYCIDCSKNKQPQDEEGEVVQNSNNNVQNLNENPGSCSEFESDCSNFRTRRINSKDTNLEEDITEAESRSSSQDSDDTSSSLLEAGKKIQSLEEKIIHLEGLLSERTKPSGKLSTGGQCVGKSASDVLKENTDHIATTTTKPEQQALLPAEVPAHPSQESVPAEDEKPKRTRKTPAKTASDGEPKLKTMNDRVKDVYDEFERLCREYFEYPTMKIDRFYGQKHPVYKAVVEHIKEGISAEGMRSVFLDIWNEKDKETGEYWWRDPRHLTVAAFFCKQFRSRINSINVRKQRAQQKQAQQKQTQQQQPAWMQTKVIGISNIGQGQPGLYDPVW